MIDTACPEPAPAWLASRLKSANQLLAARWLERLNDVLAVSKAEVFPSSELLDHIPELIVEVADYLRDPDRQDIAANTAVMRKAAEMGTLRHEQRASVHQLLREYEILGDLLAEFLQAEIAAADPPLDAGHALRALRRVLQSVRVLEQQTINAFVGKYTMTIERQTEQLRSFSRLVSHEVRQPLGVLQVISNMIQVPQGDFESMRLADMLHRNVAHLTQVTDRLEGLASISRAADLMPSEQRVDLSALAGDVARQLADMAAARGVRVEVAGNLPTLILDPARTELVFINVVANAITYSDPGKSDRFVEIRTGSDASRPSVVVRDNGIGIPAGRVEQIIRECVRVPNGDDEPGAEAFGQGLSIVRDCMHASRGDIRLESTEGQGTTVTLTWPQTGFQGSQVPKFLSS